jgi:hypothetical protein
LDIPTSRVGLKSPHGSPQNMAKYGGFCIDQTSDPVPLSKVYQKTSENIRKHPKSDIV